MTKKKDELKRPGVEEIIRKDAAYSKGELCFLLDMGEDCWQTAVRQGLRICKVGKKRWVRGASVLDWLKSCEGETAGMPRRKPRKRAEVVKPR